MLAASWDNTTTRLTYSIVVDVYGFNMVCVGEGFRYGAFQIFSLSPRPISLRMRPK